VNAEAGRLTVWKGDITTLAVDAIVNAANNSLLGGGGVDGAIHRAAGPALLDYCRKLGGCPTGEARLTPGFRLPARYVLHTVGPVWGSGENGEGTLLAACYKNCIALALALDLRTLAFPAISCGIYGYPLDMAARIAVRECKAGLAAHARIERITLVAFNAEMEAVLRAALDS
jgi:O-acetyl-ADP-ribose deacetylase (regulator of RNase III)